MKFNRFLAATALVSAASLPHAAFAQSNELPSEINTQDCTTQERNADGTCPKPAADGEQGEVITVTGSRIARPNLDTTVPVTSVSAQELFDTANLSLGDEISRLPQFRSTTTQANSTQFIGTAGINSLDLRGLGTARTLVVVNGRRHVTSSPGAYTVDTNTIPNALLEKVDVVTGGSSAVYGSDAIAGVVNFILKRDFEGVDLRVQGGVTDRGDRGSQTVNLVVGKNFLDNRLNVAVALEYAHQETLLMSDRNDQTGAFTGAPGFYTTQATSRLVNGVLVNEPAAGDGIPDTTFIGVNGGPYPGGTIVGGSRFGSISLGGTVATSCIALTNANQTNPLVLNRRSAVCTGGRSPTSGVELSDNYVFLPDGTLVRDRPTTDLRPNGGGRFGGLTATGLEGAMLLPGLDRYAANLLLNYQVSSAFEPFFEGKYVRITANQTSTQPTFVAGTLSPSFTLDNAFLSNQARQTLQTILGTTSTTAAFTMQRFNNDLGTRSEEHLRETYRFVGGFRGDLSSTGNVRYEIAANYGRTSTYYETGGNVLISRFNAAKDAVRNAAGQIVCRVNADTNTANDMPGCVPINLFGEGNISQAGKDYVLFTSSRKQWAEQINAVGFISGDTSGFFKLPGGAVAASVGAEYRREDAYSAFDPVTQSGQTFLNSAATFDPPAVELYEGFGEVRVPLLADLPFIRELTLEGAGRFSKYSTADKGVWAYNYGGIWSPFRGLRLRASYARSVRQANLGELYQTRAQTFANGFVDPCSQGSPITSNPNRARNCAAAGVPTTLTYVDDAGVSRTIPWVNTLPSGLSGFNQGNLNLQPEVGKSLTLGAVFEPSFLPGFSLTVDYYNIKVENVISGLSGQGIIDRCYDDPVGINNPFCSAVFRRSAPGTIGDQTFAGQNGRTLDGVAASNSQLAVTGPGFLNQPFNYAMLKTSGIDVELGYRREIGEFNISTRLLLSWLQKRESYLFINEPSRSTRLHGTLGDPEWQANYSFDVRYRNFDFGYDVRFIDKMTVGAWETQFAWQGRQPTNADAFPFKWYPSTFYHNIQLGVRANDRFRLFAGIDNILDTLPPYGLTGTGSGSGVYSIDGRSFYAGARVTF